MAFGRCPECGSYSDLGVYMDGLGFEERFCRQCILKKIEKDKEGEENE